MCLDGVESPISHIFPSNIPPKHPIGGLLDGISPPG